MTTVSPNTVTTASATRVRAARPRALPVHAGAVVLFAGVAGLLGVRMAAGEDPALGDGGRPLTPPAARPVLVRRVVVTRRVIEIPAATAAAPGPAGAGSAPGTTAAAAPAASAGAAAPVPQERASATPEAPTSTAAPAPVAEPAPAATPAPAAAPAQPAPVVTTTS